jgi:phage tail-like protein
MPGKTGSRRDPELNCFFEVHIDQVKTASFAKCSGLKWETETFELQEGGLNESVHKLIGQTRTGNIVLTQGFVNDPFMFQWREEITSTGVQQKDKIKRRSGSIVQLAANGTEIARWSFRKAWPVRWEMGEYDAMSGAAQCEILELAVEAIDKSRQ